jgi:hypothetical protein
MNVHVQWVTADVGTRGRTSRRRRRRRCQHSIYGHMVVFSWNTAVRG